MHRSHGQPRRWRRPEQLQSSTPVVDILVATRTATHGLSHLDEKSPHFLQESRPGGFVFEDEVVASF